MITLKLDSSYEVAVKIAQKVKAKRLSLNMSQRTLAENSGVRYGTLKKFERSGQISLASLLQIALALDELESFYSLFAPSSENLPSSIDKLLIDTSRKRGRK